MRVKGPNGLVLNIPDEIARSLVNSPSGDHVEVKDEPKPVKKTAPKPSKK
jgi:hypothetical protein